MTLLVTSSTLMMSAAVISSLRVFRIRPTGCASVSPGKPSTSGMTATPVSKPESPSASLGKRSIATTIILNGLPCVIVTSEPHSTTYPGRCHK
jgi:hypothetical protein